MVSGKFPSWPILLVDDEPHALESFEVALKTSGVNNTLRCQDAREVVPLVRDHEVGVILLDLLMPHSPGEKVLEEVLGDFPDVPVIMVTGVREIDSVVRCMRQGAFDYVLKPVDKDRLIPSVRRAIEVNELRRENSRLARHFLTDDLESPEAFSSIITCNKRMHALFQYCEAIAGGHYPVLISGETGVGKELFAQALHNLSGREGEFIAVNVAGVDETFFSDTLFGHTRNAFTGANEARRGLVEQAAGGTLFLDEIGDLPNGSQVKLLRLLEQREYYPIGSDMAKPADVRIVTATHSDVEALMKAGQFRADLYYRLNTHRVHVPPLRERLDDLHLLLDGFLEEVARELGRDKPTYHQELLTLLAGYHFPGNVRELKSMVIDAVSGHGTRMLSSQAFQKAIRPNVSSERSPHEGPPAARHSWVSQLDGLPTLKEATSLLVAEAMRRANNNQKVAALTLGITPQAPKPAPETAPGIDGLE